MEKVRSRVVDAEFAETTGYPYWLDGKRFNMAIRANDTSVIEVFCSDVTSTSAYWELKVNREVFISGETPIARNQVRLMYRALSGEKLKTRSPVNNFK